MKNILDQSFWVKALHDPDEKGALYPFSGHQAVKGYINLEFATFCSNFVPFSFPGSVLF